jgi:hypothetical protein
MEERRGAGRVLVRKSKRKKPVGRYRGRLEDNIKMNVQEMGCTVDWIELAQDRDT